MIQMGNLEAMRQMYDEFPKIVNFTDADGWNALFFAVSTDQVEVVDWLLTLTSIDKNSRDKNGISIFDWAALRGHIQLCKVIFTSSPGSIAAPSQTLSLPDNPLSSASPHSSSSPKPGKQCANVLHYAAYSGNDEAFEWLRSHVTKCDINARDADGASPAHYSALKGHIGLTRALLDDDNINVDLHRDNDGATLLHYAALGGHLDLCKMLCDERGDLAAMRSNKGLDAGAYARLHGHSKVAEFIHQVQTREGKVSTD